MNSSKCLEKKLSGYFFSVFALRGLLFPKDPLKILPFFERGSPLPIFSSNYLVV